MVGMRKWILIALGVAALGLTACRHLEQMDGPVRLTALMEGEARTKTSLSPAEGGGYEVLWSASDKIGVYVDDGSTPVTFNLTEGAGSAQATFTGKGVGDQYLAVYPQSAFTSRSGNTLQLTLPAEQTYRQGAFADGAFPMVAVSESAVLPFRNLCSIIRLSLTGTQTVSRIVFRSNDPSVKVSGKASVDVSNPDAPVLTMASDACDSLVLNTGSVKLKADTPTDFYLVVPAQTYTDGFSIRVYADGTYMDKEYNSSFTTVRSLLHKAGVLAFEPVPDAVSQGFKLTFQMEGIYKLEIECVDGYPLDVAGNSIITFTKDLVAGQEYTIGTLPCDVYGGYRLSIFRADQVAHFFGVHQVIEEGIFISPLDLDESELEFVDPDAPLVEEERPDLDSKTKELLRVYKQNPTDENYQALYEQMGVRYDKVVARKKAKLRELEREAKHESLVEEMQAIVDEMVVNREERLWQRFLSLIDSRKDDNPDDGWCVLKGAWQENAYIGYVPVTNADYAAYKSGFTYPTGEDRYPVVNISYNEAVAYCNWLGTQDTSHSFRLPTEYEWILAAGHMPKDVSMNANHVETGLTSVDAYQSSVGNCGGIDFWGNCWEWTSTQDSEGKYLIKGGAWDTSRDECRTEYSGASRDGSTGYANVGFRVVRVDSGQAGLNPDDIDYNDDGNEEPVDGGEIDL